MRELFNKRFLGMRYSNHYTQYYEFWMAFYIERQLYEVQHFN